MAMGAIALALLLAVSLYVVWRVIGVIRYLLREYYVLWIIATGGREKRRQMNTNMRLYLYVCQTDLLDEASIIELYRFLNGMMDSEVTLKEFHKVVLSYTYVILTRERNDGSLRGIFFIGIDRKRRDSGEPYTVMRFGLGFFHHNYRGGPYHYYAGVYLFIRELIAHPRTPLYVVSKCFSFKSYLIGAHSMRYFYPSYNLETPEFVRDIINDYGHKVKLPNETYDTDTFVLARERVAMKDFLTTVSKDDLKNPDIKFFVERNPGWAHGHQLIVLGLIRWSDVMHTIWRMLTKALKGSKKKGARKSKFLRRNTFQVADANKYSSHFREFDITGYHHPKDLEDLAADFDV